MEFKTPETEREALLAEQAASDAMQATAEIANAKTVDERREGVKKLGSTAKKLVACC